jgi:hypothetical protein
MPTITSPVEQAIKAVSILFDNLFDDTTKIFIDDSCEDLEKLTKQLIQANCKSNPPSQNQNKISTILIRIGNRQGRKNQPYADLLESLIDKNKLEISCQINSIVVDSMAHHNNSASSQSDSSRNEELYSFLSKQRLTIGFDNINDCDKKNTATKNLLNWGKLESFSDTSKDIFSRFVGGIKPLVYIFDDYNNLIDVDNEIYQADLPIDDKNYQKIQKYYTSISSSQSSSLREAVKEFCLCLNQISLAFDVRAPKIRFDKDPNKCFEIVEKKLDFPKLDRERGQIAAFIIDIEWLPSPEWILNQSDKSLDLDRHHDHNEEMGHIAVKLLSQRYPEIPCFVFTGMWSIETLQKSLAAGAAWCFQKPITHHLGKPSQPNEELNSFNLERHLNDFAKRTYGTYEQLHKPDQFNAQSNIPAIAELEQSLGMKFPRQRKEELQNIQTLKPQEREKRVSQERKENLSTENFRHLIARLFTADRIEVVRVIGSGKSGAATTFFVSPTSDRLTEATRFVKIGNWLEIQKEYAAYQQIIKPKLNNHIARIIQPPAVIPNQQTNSSQIDRSNATIVSSLAGFPENYDKLRPLQEIFNNHIGEPKGAKKILPFILETIEYVLLPLQLPTKQKDYYLAAIAPSAYTGSLIPMQSIDFNNRCNAENIICGNNQTLTLNEDNPKKCYLQNWIITEIRPLKKEPSKIEVILAHPTLKARIKLKGDKEDAQKRFGALWLKLGMRISVDVEIDPPTKTQEKASKRLTEICRDALHLDSLADLIEIWNKTDDNQVAVEDPFLLFSKGDEIVKLTGIGQFGGIHGDLNLNNILYPNEEKVGFLIDFSESELEGLAAFDLAWLEAQIWNYYLFPNLIELDRSSPLGLYKLLHLALEAMNYCAYPADFFITKTSDSERNILKQLLNTICNTLTITNSVRQYFTRKLSISFQCDDVHYALAVCFLRQSNFDIESKNSPQNNKLINILSYLCSAHYLKATTSTLKMSDISRS